MARNPGTFSTLKTTDTSTGSLIVGATVGGSTPLANSGMKVATISLEQLAAPSITTNKLYSIAGSLYFNGASIALGTSASGTANTIGMFTGPTALGNSILTQNGGATLVTVTGALTVTGTATANLFSGSGASLTAIPTSAVSSGNFVATVASGTGITSSVTSGNAAATTVTLNNTAVTPTAYGSSTSIPSFTVDQQGRLTAAAGNAVVAPAGTLTGATLAAGVTASSLTSVGTLTSLIVGGNLTIPAAAQFFLDGGGDTSLQEVSANTVRFVVGGAQLWQLDSVGVHLSSTGNITDGIGVPTISSGFGTSPSIAGKAYAFKVTVGTSSTSSGVINFGTTFAVAPIVTTSSEASTGAGSIIAVSSISTTQATFTRYLDGSSAPANFSNGQIFYVMARGY